MSVRMNSSLRTIYLLGDVTAKMAILFRRKMNILNASASAKKITVEICSQGGDIDAGFSIADTIRSSSSSVDTYAVGEVMSAATLILAAGDYRKSLANTSIMVHQGDFVIKGSIHQITKAELPAIQKSEDTYSRLLEQLTDKPAGYWDEKWKHKNCYLTPSEAMELGIIDEVVNWQPRRGRSV